LKVNLWEEDVKRRLDEFFEGEVVICSGQIPTLELRDREAERGK
jgi:hypothetical protein